MLSDYKGGEVDPVPDGNKPVDIDTTAGQSKDFTVPEAQPGEPAKQRPHRKTALLMLGAVVIIILLAAVFWYWRTATKT